MRKGLTAFVLGLLSGLALAWVIARYLLPALPASFGGTPTLETTVVEKRREAQRLLLTVNTPEQAVLVTFTDKLEEIDLLVAVGDVVTLRLPDNTPFAENPAIEKVKKSDRPPPGIGDPPAAAAAARPAAGDGQPGRQRDPEAGDGHAGDGDGDDQDADVPDPTGTAADGAPPVDLEADEPRAAGDGERP